MLNFKPAPGLIVIKPLEETYTIKYENEDLQTLKGTVISKGNPFITEKGNVIECPVEVGEIILHSKFGHQDFEEQGETYRIVKFTEILGTFVSEEK